MDAVRCPRCHGTGELPHPSPGPMCPEPTIPCPECDGLGGWEVGDPTACDDCGDSRQITEPTGETRNGRPVWRCRRCTDNLHRDEVA